MAKHLEPKQYNVSVRRAEAVAIFEEHRTVSLKTARQAVEKSGFTYLRAELTALGHLAWSGQPGESELLLKDPEADMTLRLTASDTDTAFTTLKQTFQGGDLGDTVQVRGTAVESKQARKKAREAGARATLSVTEWSAGKTAKLPPLVPEGNRKKTSTNQDQGWF